MNRKSGVPIQGAALKEYINKKRRTNGAYSTWSDNIIFEAMSQVLDRPIMQLTYPRYVDGEAKPELGPSFFLSKGGARTKLPIFVHYNGINHYNTFVPKSYKGASPAAKPAGAQMGKPAASRASGPAFGHMLEVSKPAPIGT